MGLARWLAVVSCAACARPVVPTPPRSSGTLAFSDSRAITALALAGDRLYVGTPRGLVVWDLAGGTRAAGAAAGLEAEPIRAIAPGAEGTVWVATEGAVWRIDGDRLEPVPMPGEAAAPLALLALGDEVWVGTELGVALVRRDTSSVVMPEARVTVMIDAGGGAWVGTSNAGVAHVAAPDRVEYHVGKHGLRLVDVRALAPFGEGGLLAAGADDKGALVALFDGVRWRHFRPLAAAPGVKADVLPIGAIRGETLIAAAGAIYALAAPAKDEPPAPLRLDPEDGGGVLALARRPGLVPAGVTAALADEREGVLLGTRSLGVMRADGRALRLRDLRGSLVRLHVGCAGPRCWFAGGDGVGYVVEGDRIEPAVVDAARDARVLAFASRDARVLALHATRGKPVLRASREGDGKFAPLAAELRVPTGEPEVTFAAVSPTGELWAGLGWRDQGRLHPWGVAVWSADGKAVVRHGAPSKDAGGKASLVIPDDARSVLFSGEDVWLATGQGVCRIRDGKVKRYTENDALEGENTLDVVAVGRDIWALMTNGLNRFDGRGWDFDSGGGPVGGEARTLARGSGAIVYAATEHGIVRVDGDDRGVLGRALGLLDEDVSDVVVDAQGRLWALTADGIAVVRDPRPPRPRAAAPARAPSLRKKDAPDETGD